MVICALHLLLYVMVSCWEWQINNLEADKKVLEAKVAELRSKVEVSHGRGEGTIVGHTHTLPFYSLGLNHENFLA